MRGICIRHCGKWSCEVHTWSCGDTYPLNVSTPSKWLDGDASFHDKPILVGRNILNNANIFIESHSYYHHLFIVMSITLQHKNAESIWCSRPPTLSAAPILYVRASEKAPGERNGDGKWEDAKSCRCVKSNCAKKSQLSRSERKKGKGAFGDAEI